jgi:hypothetical protein
VIRFLRILGGVGLLVGIVALIGAFAGDRTAIPFAFGGLVGGLATFVWAQALAYLREIAVNTKRQNTDRSN